MIGDEFETRTLLIINGDAISVTLKDAEILYQKLRKMFEPPVPPMGELFNPNQRRKECE